MQNMNEELKATEQQHQKTLDQIKRKHSILSQLGNVRERYVEPWIHFYKLHGTHGTISFKPQAFTSLQRADENNPDATLLISLLQQFPPLPLKKVSDGRVSFRHVDQPIPPIAASEDCFGVTVRVETSQIVSAAFEWLAQLGEEIWRFAVTFPWSQTDLGQLNMQAERYPDGTVDYWKFCDLRPKHAGQRVRWASDRKSTPNDFTIYWTPAAGAALDFSVLIKIPASPPVAS